MYLYNLCLLGFIYKQNLILYLVCIIHTDIKKKNKKKQAINILKIESETHDIFSHPQNVTNTNQINTSFIVKILSE